MGALTQVPKSNMCVYAKRESMVLRDHVIILMCTHFISLSLRYFKVNHSLFWTLDARTRAILMRAGVLGQRYEAGSLKASHGFARAADGRSSCGTAFGSLAMGREARQRSLPDMASCVQCLSILQYIRWHVFYQLEFLGRSAFR